MKSSILTRAFSQVTSNKNDNLVFSLITSPIAARSEVFHRMFSNEEFEETQQNVMIVEDVTIVIFKLFLQFVYTNQMPLLSLHGSTEVFKLAHKYDVRDLIKMCDDTMVRILKKDDPVHNIYQLSQLFNCSQELKKKSFDLVKS